MGSLTKSQYQQHLISNDSRPISSIMSCLGTGFSNSGPSAVPLVPEPIVDSFITDLLQAVTDDVPQLCSSCEEGIHASSRCRDCSELLCDPCVRAHQRVRLTKDHRIVRFANSGSLGSSSQASNSPNGASNNNFCDIHQEPHRLYCETCSAGTCTECTLLEHRGHQLIYIQDAVDSARKNSLRLSAETRSAITAVREAIDNVQRMTEGVEVRSHQAAADVRNLIKRFITAIEDRERELLTRIEYQRQLKGKALLSQMENLRNALTKLARTSEMLNESIETGSGLDLIIANERASAELKKLRSVRSELIPCEDDNILFMPPDQSLLRAISLSGNINTTRSNVIMRTLAKEINMFAPLVELKSDNYVHMGLLQRGLRRGRPIHGSILPVVAIDGSGANPLLFGTEGENDGQLCRPWGVCCDKNGNIIVADRSNNRVQIFHSNGAFAHKFGTQGTGPGQFDRPAGVAIDPHNRIVVADKDNHRIQLFTLDGEHELMFGEKGCRNGQFNYPWDVAVNSQGHIVVSDTRNHRIQLFTNEGVFLNKYGFEATVAMWKHFDSPRGVCFHPSGHVIVTDFNNHRLVIVDDNFMNAQFLGQEGSGFKQFLRPQGIVCDDEGRIIIADSKNNRIQVIESGGTFLWKMGKAGICPGEFDRPSGICLNPEGRIVVVDFGNCRVQIF